MSFLDPGSPLRRHIQRSEYSRDTGSFVAPSAKTSEVLWLHSCNRRPPWWQRTPLRKVSPCIDPNGSGSWPDFEDSSHMSLLMLAAEGSSAAVVRSLLDAKALVNTANAKQETALILAVLRGDEPAEAVHLLVAAKADVDAQDSEGRSALHVCSRRGFAVAARVLLEQGADQEGPLALCRAVEGGHHETAKTLVEFGAEPGGVGEHGMSAIQLARLRRDVQMVNCLMGDEYAELCESLSKPYAT